MSVAPAPLRDGLVERVRPDGERFVQGPLSWAEVEARLGAPLAAGGGRSGGSVISFDVPLEVDNVAALVVPETGERVTAVGFYTDAVTALAPDGTTLWTTLDPGCGPYDVDDRGGVVVVACVRGRRMLILDAATGEIRHRVAASSGVAQVRLSADGTRAVGGMGGATLAGSRLLIVDTADGRIDRAIPAPFQGSGFSSPRVSNRSRIFFTPIAISDDGSRVATGTFDGLFAFDAETGAQRLAVDSIWIPESLELSADGGTLLAPYGIIEPARVDFHDLDAGTLAAVPLPADASYPLAALVPDASAALVSVGAEVQILGPGLTPTTVLDGFDAQVAPLGLGRAVVRTLFEASVVDLATGSVLATRPSYEYSWPERLRDGRTYARTVDFEDIRVHDLVADAFETRQRPGAAPEVDGARFLTLSADGARVAISHTLSHQVGVYDAETFEQLGLYTLDGPTAGLTFLPGDAELLVAAGGALLRLDAETGDVRQVVFSPVGLLGHVFVRGGRAFVYAGADGTVEVYDLTAEGLVPLATAPFTWRLSTNLGVGTVSFVAVTPDGRRVLGMNHGTPAVEVYDVESDALVSLPTAGSPWGIQVSSDSQYAIAMDFEGRAYQISLGAVPALDRTVTIPGLEPHAATYDAVRKGFWVGRAGPTLDAVLLDPATGAIVETKTLGDYGLLHQLLWTPETGLAAAVTDALQLYPGSPDSYTTFGRLITATGVVDLPTAPGQLAAPTASGKVLATLPGPDGLAFAAGVPVGAAAPPAPDLVLRTLGSPSAGRLRVELDGPARSALRVEVVDVLGRVVSRLHDGAFSGGRRELTWDGAAPGTYLVRVAGERLSVRATVVR